MRHAGCLVLLVLVAVAAVVGCEPPRTEGYRRVEVSSSGSQHIQFTCKFMRTCGNARDIPATTPWSLEVNLDTIGQCMCGTRCLVYKTTDGTETLQVDAYNRDTLHVSGSVTTQAETVLVWVRDMECFHLPRPDSDDASPSPAATFAGENSLGPAR